MTDLPPYARLLDLRIEDLGNSVRYLMPFHDDVVGRPGFLHGGAIAGLLEFAAFSSLERAIGDPAVVKKPTTVTVDYMRGGTPTDTYAEAIVERLGNRIANVEAVAWQRDRAKPIAAARINFLLERP
ncbi:PaaI family thioesterase [Sphingomonas jaspsi]|uniref:PaaI family thioesterase n=1 Tax=Sphingomonas jaspsi TaxID=392409 RepID=UPI0004BAE8BF|nr:PaaI family thioesterase [Sphingomonas jaspsi]